MSGHFGTVVLFFICLILPHGMDNLKRKEADADLTSKVGFSFHNNIKRPPLQWKMLLARTECQMKRLP